MRSFDDNLRQRGAQDVSDAADWTFDQVDWRTRGAAAYFQCDMKRWDNVAMLDCC